MYNTAGKICQKNLIELTSLVLMSPVGDNEKQPLNLNVSRIVQITYRYF